MSEHARCEDAPAARNAWRRALTHRWGAIAAGRGTERVSAAFAGRERGPVRCSVGPLRIDRKSVV